MATATSRQHTDVTITLTLVLIAAIAWWTTARLAAEMTAMSTEMTIAPYLVGWVAMMAAMMLPAVTPVVRLYARAAALHRVAPTAVFTLGYLLVWCATGVPAWFLWRAMAIPLMDGQVWAYRASGAVLLAAGSYQLTPLKRACLRHCRSPMSVFLRARSDLATVSGAAVAGATHALYCFGCCVGLMVVLVAAGSMQLWWAVVIAVVIFLERNVPAGEQLAAAAAMTLSVLGLVVLVHPGVISSLVQGGMS
jgi:predicted metal-binding membrane protein